MTHTIVSLGAVATRFTVGYILLLVVLFAVAFGLDYMFGFAPESSTAGLLVPFFAAFDCGTWVAQKSTSKPPKAFAWKAAFCFTLITVMLTALIIKLLHLNDLMPELDEFIADRASLTILTGVAAGFSLLLIPFLRLGFGWGVRQTLKLREKAARG